MTNTTGLLAISMILSFALIFATTTSFHAFAQMNQTAQNINNQTQANQTTTTPSAANQTSQQTNQSSSQQQQQLNPEELLNSTNAAIIALNEDDDEQAAQLLSQIQQQLINATGKEVLIVPSATIDTDDED